VEKGVAVSRGKCLLTNGTAQIEITKNKRHTGNMIRPIVGTGPFSSSMSVSELEGLCYRKRIYRSNFGQKEHSSDSLHQQRQLAKKNES